MSFKSAVSFCHIVTIATAHNCCLPQKLFEKRKDENDILFTLQTFGRLPVAPNATHIKMSQSHHLSLSEKLMDNISVDNQLSFFTHISYEATIPIKTGTNSFLA